MNERPILFRDSPCPACGVMLSASLLYKRKERGNMLEMKCRKCYGKSANYHESRVRDLETGLVCYPWRGEMDYDRMVCLNEAGEAIYLGERICGHADCINEDHVIVKVPGTWSRPKSGELKHKRKAKAVR
jgi:hypothetical protein